VSVEIYVALRRKGKGSDAKELESRATEGEACPKQTAQSPEQEKSPCLCAGCRSGRAYPTIKHQKGSWKQVRKQKGEEKLAAWLGVLRINCPSSVSGNRIPPKA